MSKQLTFPWPTVATKIHPSGYKEKLKYGQYETIMIVKENGFSTDRIIKLINPIYPVTEVECEDGTKLFFEKSFYCIEQ